jgi:hypothetical protein
MVHVSDYYKHIPVKLQKTFEEQQGLFPTNYTIVDFLLDRQEWMLCRQIFDLLRSVLTE